MKIREKNITTFSNDASKNGRYVYTDQQKLSAKIANQRQSLEIIRLLLTHVGKGKRILDIGCGDGTYTLELYQLTKPSLIVGFDPAKKAIAVAKQRIPTSAKKKMFFETSNIYDIDKHFKRGKYDVAVIRGVLHHLYDAPKAVEKISRVVDTVIVLEPNGYNPILKVIEKVSPYHTQHEEKSYWPPALNSWFIDTGYAIKEQKFVCIVPYFCPDWMAKILKKIEPFFEALPFVHKFYAGTNVFFATKH